MCRLCIDKLEPGVAHKPDVAGQRVTITIPQPPARVQTWQDFLKWLQENPDIIAVIITAIITLLGTLEPPPKA